MYHQYIKRFFDIILSPCCIIVSSPILLVTALLVRIKLGSPVIFKQERPGYHNEIFTLYKFRSMTDAVDENGDLLPDKERLPRFGQMLRICDNVCLSGNKERPVFQIQESRTLKDLIFKRGRSGRIYRYLPLCCRQIRGESNICRL